MSKKLRFEVFSRDSFTCQYCGISPPDANLHVDHIIPVAAGGTNDIDNLATACQSCNTGKGADILHQTRPIGDLLREYSANVVAASIKAAMGMHIKTGAEPTRDQVKRAWHDVPAFCRLRRCYIEIYGEENLRGG